MSKEITIEELNKKVGILTLKLNAMDKRLNRHLCGDTDNRSPYDPSDHPLKRKRHA